jgi:hypothetical protein
MTFLAIALDLCFFDKSLFVHTYPFDFSTFDAAVLSPLTQSSGEPAGVRVTGRLVPASFFSTSVPSQWAARGW